MAVAAIVRTKQRMVPPSGTDNKRFVAEMFRNIDSARLDWVGEFTLRANQTTTTLSDTRIALNSAVIWAPVSANAAASMNNLYLSTIASGSIILTHSNTADADKRYRFVIIG